MIDKSARLEYTVVSMLNRFGERIREVREKLGLTQEEFADQLGIARASLALYESEKRMPKVDILARLVEVTGVSPDFFLGRIEAMEHNSHEIKELLGLTDASLIAIADANAYAINHVLAHPAFHALLEYISVFVSPVITPEVTPSVLESARVRAHVRLEEIINDTCPDNGSKPEEALSNRSPITNIVMKDDKELKKLLNRTDTDRQVVDRRPGSVSRARVLSKGDYTEIIKSLYEQIKLDQSLIIELEERIKAYSVAIERIRLEEKASKSPTKIKK